MDNQMNAEDLDGYQDQNLQDSPTERLLANAQINLLKQTYKTFEHHMAEESAGLDHDGVMQSNEMHSGFSNSIKSSKTNKTTQPNEPSLKMELQPS